MKSYIYPNKTCFPITVRNFLLWLLVQWAHGFSGDHEQKHNKMSMIALLFISSRMYAELYSVGNKKM